MRAAVALALLLTMAAAPDPTSDDYATMAPHKDWIARQRSINGAFCCNLSDGRPAETRRVAGHWEVKYSREHWAGGNGQWLVVPPEAVLPNASPLYVPIAWISYGQVRCLALAGVLLTPSRG